jgi:CRISPR/Cas system-associated exonuclease Cas4 (RecB family)
MKKQKCKTALDYYDGRDHLPKDIKLRISPSSFNTFMSKPHEWYRQQILGEDKFEGNTSSVLGTVVHYVAECYAKGESVNKDEIEDYINSFEDNDEVDITVVRQNYKSMAEVLVNGYIMSNKPTEVEKFLTVDLGDGVYLGGSVDNLTGTMVVDYKTYNSKSKPKSIPLGYKYQLLLYALMYIESGVDIDRVRLVYVNRHIDGGISEKTGKPLKSYPPEVTVLTETVTNEDIDFIVDVVTMCKETYLASLKHPELTHLLYRDMRLKKEDN